MARAAPVAPSSAYGGSSAAGGAGGGGGGGSSVAGSKASLPGADPPAWEQLYREAPDVVRCGAESAALNQRVC